MYISNNFVKYSNFTANNMMLLQAILSSSQGTSLNEFLEKRKGENLKFLGKTHQK